MTKLSFICIPKTQFAKTTFDSIKIYFWSNIIFMFNTIISVPNVIIIDQQEPVSIYLWETNFSYNRWFWARSFMISWTKLEEIKSQYIYNFFLLRFSWGKDAIYFKESQLPRCARLSGGGQAEPWSGNFPHSSNPFMPR